MNIYMANVSEFIDGVRMNLVDKERICPGLSRVKEGICISYCIFDRPLIIIQFNPNFKIKIFFLHIPLLSLKRKRSSCSCLEEQHSNRKSRIYINIGSLPYFDNRSGIPRVAKELVKQGVKQESIDCLPVYPDPVSGRYKIAFKWCRDQNLNINSIKYRNDGKGIDPEITINKGDWLIHTMVNVNELKYNETYLRSVRENGGKIGYILHDIIAEDHPEFFKKRDSKNFNEWLRLLPNADKIFAISNSTLNAYKRWLDREKIKNKAEFGVFRLGADFGSIKQFAVDEIIPKELSEKIFFLQVSTIEPRKGYADLLDAFEYLWSRQYNLSLVIVGRKGWKVNSLCRRIAHHPENGKRLFWYNSATDVLLTSLYKKCKAVIVASEAEGFGLSLIEASYFKKLVIARDIEVFREIGGENILFFSGKGQAIANSIVQSLKRNEDLMIKDFREYSWKESFVSFLSLIKGENNDIC